MPRKHAKRRRSRHAAAAVAAAIAIVATGAGAQYVNSHGGKYAFTCDSSLNKYVYKPERLIGNHTCVLAIGIVEEVRTEDDGDWHIQMHLDSGQDWMLAPGNRERQDGNLVLEVICAKFPIKQESAKIPCQGFNDKILRPHKGDHIAAVGTYVFDAENSQHSWAELHPVTSITQVPNG